MNQSLNTQNENFLVDYHRISHEHDYYDLFNGQFLATSSVNETGPLIGDYTFRGIFALVSRIGFIFVQVGSIPVENVYTIVLYNLIEIPVVLLTYGFIGNWFAFGPSSLKGWIGYGGWSKDFSFEYPDIDGAMLGFCGSLLSTAQLSSFLVGRMSIGGGIIIAVIYSGFFQPLLMHWIWHNRGWMRHSRFLGLDVSVKDHAGALALHMPSAIFGTIGALFLGRRVLLLKNLDPLSFSSEVVVNTIVGYLLIILDYIIFALPTPMYIKSHSPDNYHTIIVTNSLIAIGGGIVIVTILQLIVFREISKYRRIIRSIQGGIAGLISISACVDLYAPGVSILLSVIAGLFFFFFAEVLHKTALEDPCSFISSHLICGFIGVLLCPLLAQGENLGGVKMRTLGVHVLWQFLCVLVVIGLTIVIALIIFLLLKICRILRNSFEVANHKRATVLRNAVPKRAFLERLFGINSTTDYVVPGHRMKYFGTKSSSEPRTLTTTKPVEADKITFNQRRIEINKAGPNNVTVMQFATEQVPAKRNSSWQTSGSGDYYYDPYLQLKPICSAKLSTDIFNKCHGTSSSEGYNEV